ncbi:ankyrin repeat domain-containing protein [Burkholderia cenocepacia]|uniref:ankyrin repeat domain-containing protein n=1 Tax=Burkholderia cenocepacia TaxID=95486 RepID=UPI0013DF85F5|nr:ankyrin repeat domain-containing protein [Burkholderia cenocepacia]MCW3587413.1 ankyrin repeat domain-containing protein [Burkholderia cenocepacia]MCW3633891.1 ankyrin repeat domain-containing protein [Burkholderia cenocepacia]MCW5184793.1 ankyrin repeat domain-containing protein [Burkholderia cenocepacia]NGO98023.1 hypothetical protein [Burkholderia cenocepacia]
MGFKDDYFSEIRAGDETKAMSLLATHNFDPDLRERLFEGRSALAVAADAGKEKLVRELIARGGDVNNSDGTFSVLHHANDASIAKLLIEAGADVNASTQKAGNAFSKGTTALHMAARANDLQMVEILLRAGANVDARDVDGVTPLHAGAMNPGVVDALLAAGANVDARMLNGTSAQDLIEHFSRPVTGVFQAPVEPTVSAVEVEGVVEGVIRRAEPQKQVQSVVAPATATETAVGRDAYIAASRGEVGMTDEEVATPRVVTEPSPEEPVNGIIRRAEPQTNSKPVAPAPVSDDDEQRKIRNAAPQQKQADEPTRPVPKTLLGGRFIGDENGNYRRAGEKTIAIRDENNEILLNDKQIETFLAGLELAKSKGWSAIEVEGSQRFRREAWLRGQQEGMEVLGFEPTSKDMDELAQILERKAADQIAPGVAASLDDAKGLIVDSKRGFVAPNYDNGNYAGTVLGETDHHYVVSVDGRAGTATAIDKSKLDGMSVKKDEMLRVKFQAGKVVPPREQSRSLAR